MKPLAPLLAFLVLAGCADDVDAVEPPSEVDAVPEDSDVITDDEALSAEELLAVPDSALVEGEVE